MTKKICFLLLLVGLVSLTSLTADRLALAGETPGTQAIAPLFWNKLESLESEIGPDVEQRSYIIPDWGEAYLAPAQFGNGLFVNHETNEGFSNNGANFFATDLSQVGLSPVQGTIEFWFRFRYDSSVWNHAYFLHTARYLTDHFEQHWPSWVDNALLVAGWSGWDYGDRGKQFFVSINSNIGCGTPEPGAQVMTPPYSAGPGGYLDFHDGTLTHFAYVWDVNGIDGTTDTLRLYVNGNLEGASSDVWDTTCGFDQYMYIGTVPNAGSWESHYNAVKGVTDNLKMYGYAKTDFSDRFNESPNQPPDCSAAAPSVSLIWPPDHIFWNVTVLGVTDPDGDELVYTIDSIYQDEPVDSYGDGRFTPDGRGLGTATAEVRAERAGTKKVPGDGRFYHIGFTATDPYGEYCVGTISVVVPHDMSKTPVDQGPLYDSTVP